MIKASLNVNRSIKRGNKKESQNKGTVSLNGGLRPDVFISYSAKDKEFIRVLERRLKSIGRRAWVDRNDVQPTEEWLKAIHSGIEAAFNFAFVISPDSISSQYCQDELDHAIKHNKRLIPILRRDVERKLLPASIATLNWIDFRSNKELDHAVQSLINILETDLDYVRAHTRLLTRAIEWEANDKNKSFLLRGIDLQEAARWLAQSNRGEQPAPTLLQIEYVIASNTAQRRVRRVTLATVIVGLIIAIAFAILYRSQRNQAVNQAQIALARQLATQSELIRDQGPTLLPRSVLLAIESIQRSPSLEADMALRHGLNILPRNIYNVKLSGHPRAIAYTPDGKYIAVTRGQISRMVPDDPDEGIEGPTVWILEAATGQETLQLKHENNVNAIAFSPNEHLLATASDDHSARIWEIPTGRELISLTHSEEVKNVMFSPDGKYLFTRSGKENTGRLWEIRAGTEIKHFKNNGYGGMDAFDAGGKYLVTITDDHLYFRKGRENELITSFIRTNKIDRIYLSSNEKYLATVKDNYVPEFSEPIDHTILVWDISRGVEIAHIKYSGPFEKLIFSPSSKYFIILGVLDFVHQDFVYETDGAGQVMRLEPEGKVSQVRFSNDDKYLATVVADGTVRVFDLATRQEAARMISDGNALNSAFSPDSKYLLTTSDRGVAQVWSAIGGQEIARIDDDRGNGRGDWRVTSISPDGKYLSAIRDTVMLGEKINDSFRIWEITSGNEIISLRRDADCLNYKLSPDQRYVAADCADHSIRVWDMATGTETGSINNTQAEKRSSNPWPGHFIPYALSMGGKYVVARESVFGNSEFTRSKDWPVLVWDVTSGSVAMRLPHPKHGMFAEFSPDGKYIATSGETVRIWDIPSGREIARLASPNVHLEFSPTSEFLLTIGEKSASQLWQVKTGQEIKRINLENARFPIVFSPDGKYLAAANSDDTTEIWDISTGQKVARLVHTDGVSPVTFSSDGKYLATSEAWVLSDERERETVPHTDVWEVASGREVTHIEERYRRIIHFSPDGKYLIADSWQSLWILPWRVDDLISEACGRLTRNFTSEEWHMYFGDEPYHKTCPNLP